MFYSLLDFNTFNVFAIIYGLGLFCELIVLFIEWLFIFRAHTGPITCGKPILKSVIPGLCTVHLQKAQKHLQQALKKSGFNVTSSSKPAPKFHVIAAEFVHQILEKRRAAQRSNKHKVEDEPAIIEVKTETAD